MREIMVIHQPCILCEKDVQVWTVSRDDETGKERIDCEDVEHECPAMRSLCQERLRNPWA